MIFCCILDNIVIYNYSVQQHKENSISKGAPRKASALSEVFHELSAATFEAERKRGDVEIDFRLSKYNEH